MPWRPRWSCVRRLCCRARAVCSNLLEEEASDDIFEQNKVWIAIVLHALYIIFLAGCLPYIFYFVTTASPVHFFTKKVFLPITAVVSIVCIFCYVKFGRVRLLYWALVLYGLVYPYLSWGSRGVYMATPSHCWNWLTLSTILTLLLIAVRPAVVLLLLQVLTPVAGGLCDYYGPHGSVDIHELVSKGLQVVVPSCTLFLLMLFFNQVASHSRKQAALRHELGQSILRNVLPMPVADQLMIELAHTSEVHIAQDYPTATVCFCDIVGFTQLCLTISPAGLVGALNKIFTYFDRLCLLHGVEKIKTIGDAYMFVGFSEESAQASARAVVEVAVRMVLHMADFTMNNTRLQIRAGAHSGPLVAGVIGCTKFAYDVWGPTVNLASRLESSGIPGEIQVSSSTQALIAEAFPCVFRASMELKGAGCHDVYLVDRAGIVLSEESPSMLQGLGLADMSKLIQEINRRQATYMFNTNRVGPMEEALSAASMTHRQQHHQAFADCPPARKEEHGGFSGVAVCQESQGSSEEDLEELRRLPSRLMPGANSCFGESSLLCGRMVLCPSTPAQELPGCFPDRQESDDFGLKFTGFSARRRGEPERPFGREASTTTIRGLGGATHDPDRPQPRSPPNLPSEPGDFQESGPVAECAGGDLMGMLTPEVDDATDSIQPWGWSQRSNASASQIARAAMASTAVPSAAASENAGSPRPLFRAPRFYRSSSVGDLSTREEGVPRARSGNVPSSSSASPQPPSRSFLPTSLPLGFNASALAGRMSGGSSPLHAFTHRLQDSRSPGTFFRGSTHERSSSVDAWRQRILPPFMRTNSTLTAAKTPVLRTDPSDWAV